MELDRPFELRAYFFGNMYLSSIQQGIQAQHCTAEMFVRYRQNDTSSAGALCAWAQNHKTSILLNGGYSSELYRLHAHFESQYNPYPYAKFHESKEALDGALTCVGIILPDRVFDSVVHRIRINGESGKLQLATPELVSKDDYETMLKLGYWREAQFPQPTQFEVSVVKQNNLTWWEYTTALMIKRYALAR